MGSFFALEEKGPFPTGEGRLDIYYIRGNISRADWVDPAEIHAFRHRRALMEAGAGLMTLPLPPPSPLPRSMPPLHSSSVTSSHLPDKRSRKVILRPIAEPVASVTRFWVRSTTLRYFKASPRQR